MTKVQSTTFFKYMTFQPFWVKILPVLAIWGKTIGQSEIGQINLTTLPTLL